MSNAQTSHTKLFSRIGLAVSGLVMIAATSLPVAQASAQALLVKFDGKDFQLKRQGGQNGNNGNNSNVSTGSRKLQQITIGKGGRDEDASKKKQAPVIEIGKGDRDDDQKPKTKQIVIGKGDRDKADEPVKRQIIVEKAKTKKIVEAEPVIVRKKKVVVAAEPVVVKKKVAVAAQPVVEQVALADAEEPAPQTTPEVAVEAPVEEEAVTEAPAVAPVAAFKVGEIVTAGDGKSYVIIKVDASGISAMPLTAFTQYQEPAPTYKPVAKKKHKKRYSAYRNYGYSSDSCH